MSKQNKWAGNMGKVASGGQGTTGSNTYKPVPKAPAPRAVIKDNIITQRWSPGDSMGTQTISTHNSINAFTRGIKSRGPYGGPTFQSLNNSEKDMQKSDTSSISKFQNPTGNGKYQKGTAGGSGTGVLDAPSRTK